MKENVKFRARGGNSGKRDSNLELFRIITMLLIIAHHYVINSGLTLVDGPIYMDALSWRSLFLLVFGAWGKIGINCFILITGYFMCKSQITARKFVKLLGEVMFYRIVIWMIFWLSGYTPVTLKELIKAFIPITSIDTGFTSAYLVFFLCIPFLNILIQNMNEKQHIRLLVVMGFLYVFLGTIPFFKVTMNYVSWYSVLYLIASYVRLYPKKIFDNTRFWGSMTVLSVVVSVVSVVVCTWIGTMVDKNIAYYFVTDSNTFLAVLTGISSFMFFKNMRLKYSKWINTLAASTFGVLLIHAHSNIMRQWLWQDVLNNVGMYDSPYLVLHAIGSVIAIFLICMLIDYLRIHLIEIPFFKIWDKHWDDCVAWFNKVENSICKKLGIEV